MLPRLANPYSGPTDFDQLARDVPAFAPFLQDTHAGRKTIEFQDDAAVRALTAALLERDFRLRIELPSDRLCPTVPSRLEYVLFVLRLAPLTSDDPGSASLVGLDIGTGASAVYPLLAVRTVDSASSSSTSPPLRLNMLATDIDDHSLDFAKRNIVANGLAGAIQLFKVDPEGPIFPEAVVKSIEQIDFTMCNPPFYDSHAEIATSLARKELEPFAKCTGADNEMVTTGGEVAFVSRMVEESLSLGVRKIRWFTSLLGKYSSIAPLVELLKSNKILNYHVHALPPHGYTTRWVLTWSLQDRRFPLSSVTDLDAATAATANPPLASASAPSFPLSRFLSPATLPAIYFTPLLPSPAFEDPIETVRVALDEVLGDLVGGSAGLEHREEQRPGKRRRDDLQNSGGSAAQGLEWGWIAGMAKDAPGKEGQEREVWVKAWRNVWSRKARRATAQTSAAAGTAVRPLLELRIALEPTAPSPSPSPAAPSSPSRAASSQVKLTLTWLRGFDADYPALTGLWGYLTRKVGERLKELAGASVGVGSGGEKGRKKRRKGTLGEGGGAG